MAVPPRELKARAASAIAALLVAGAPSIARAADPFEIQVYDGTANEPGHAGLELHLNTVASGSTRAEPPLLPPNHQTHATFEPSFGMTRFWEIGGYVQSTIRGDGTLDYAGTKVRSKLVTPPGWHDHLRLGANFEISALPSKYDADRIGGEIRPIVAWEDEGWLFAFNPILGLSFHAHASPSFEPAAMAVRKLGSAVSAGLEYYGDIGSITGPKPVRDQEHYLYEVVNLIGIERVEVNFGVGEGLTAGSGFVAKGIFGYAF
jgi:hypothetical protein